MYYDRRSTHRHAFLIGLLNFIYSEKATQFCKIFTLLLSVSVCTVDKSEVKISQHFVVFSEFM